MNKIKFSGEYVKLHGQKKALLLEVWLIDINKSTPQAFIDYDTTMINGEKYELKSGRYLQLIFLGEWGIPFCTCRAAWPQQKEEYYRSKLGEVFEIEVKKSRVGDIF